MSTFCIAISCLTASNLRWFVDLIFNIALYSIGLCFYHQYIHNWVLFLLWLRLFILSVVISPLISSSILGTYQAREFVFQCPIFLPFHSVHGVLKARILKWFDIPFSSGPHFVITLYHDPSVLGGPTRHGLFFHWVRQGCGPCDQIGRQWQLPNPLSFYFKTVLQEPQN